jgi:hypothetical protein
MLPPQNALQRLGQRVRGAAEFSSKAYRGSAVVRLMLWPLSRDALLFAFHPPPFNPCRASAPMDSPRLKVARYMLGTSNKLHSIRSQSARENKSQWKFLPGDKTCLSDPSFWPRSP